MEEGEPKEVKKNEEKVGPIIGSIIVILVIIIGGIYFWSLIKDKIDETNVIEEPINTAENTEAPIE